MHRSIVFCICFLGMVALANATIDAKRIEAATEGPYTNPRLAVAMADLSLQGENPDDSTRFRALLVKARAYYVMSAFDQAIRMATDAFILGASAGHDGWKYETGLLMKSVFDQLGLQPLYQVLRLDDGELHIAQHPSVHFAVITSFLTDSSLQRDQAAAYFETASAMVWLQPELIRYTGWSPYYQYGLYWMNQGLPDSARVYFEKGMAECSQWAPDSYIAAQLHMALGSLFYYEQDHIGADTLFVLALKMAENLQSAVLQRDLHSWLSRNHLAMGNMALFADHNRAYSDWITRVDKQVNLGINAAHAAQHKINAYALQALQHQTSDRYRSWLFFGIGVGVFFLGWLSWEWLRFRGREGGWRPLAGKVESRLQPIHMSPADLPEVGQKQPLVPEDVELTLLVRLDQFERQDAFLSNNMSLAQLASSIDTNTKYLSDIINRHKGKNFNSYINELRVNYILRRLHKEPVYRSYKVSYLAKECGFSNHTGFSTVFKRITGMSPIGYIEQLDADQTATSNELQT